MEKQYSINTEIEQEKDFLDSFDLERFWYVFKRSRFWIIAFIILTTTVAYLYVRYTKPVFKSESVVKLDFQSEANILGLTDVINSQERNEISGEIELIKSRLFLSRVVEQADLTVSYHAYGRINNDERFKNSPFAVSFKLHDVRLYDTPFDVEPIDVNRFNLSYKLNGEEKTDTYQFGKEINTKSFNLLVERSNYLIVRSFCSV